MDKITADPFFGLFITLTFYVFFKKIHQLTGKHYLHPVITSGAAIIILLKTAGIPLANYMLGGRVILMMLPAATLFLAVPLYSRIAVVRKYLAVIIISITAGCISGVVSVILLGRLFGLSAQTYLSLASKSVTMPLALGITEKIGGIAELTAAGVVLTGISGLIAADIIFRIYSFKNPVSRGLALGTAAHILGTGKAVEMGMVESSVSSLSMVIAGIATAVIVPAALILL